MASGSCRESDDGRRGRAPGEARSGVDGVGVELREGARWGQQGLQAPDSLFVAPRLAGP